MERTSPSVLLLRRLLVTVGTVAACGGSTADGTQEITPGSQLSAGGAAGDSPSPGGGGSGAGGVAPGGASGAPHGGTGGSAGGVVVGGAGGATGGAGGATPGTGGSAGEAMVGGASGSAGGSTSGGTGGSGGKPGNDCYNPGPGACCASEVCHSLEEVAKLTKNPPPEPLTACPAPTELPSGLCYWYSELNSFEDGQCCYRYVSGSCCGRPLMTDEGMRVARLRRHAGWSV